MTAQWLITDHDADSDTDCDTDSDTGGGPTLRRFCPGCRPIGPISDLTCSRCGDGPLLVGDLAADPTGHLPDPARNWLTGAGWDLTRGTDPICPACTTPPRPAAHPGGPRMTRRPVRIQLQRTAGWRKPPGAVVVARGPGRRWGNPFAVGQPYGAFTTVVDRAHAVALYRAWLDARPDLVAAARTQLAGRDLACWCPPDQPCHADVLLEVANPDGAR